MERDVGLLQHAQRRRRAEGELVRDDEGRAHVRDDLGEAVRHRRGLPEQVSQPGLGLQAEGGDHSGAGRREEGAEVGRFARRPFRLRARRVARGAEHELVVLEAIGTHALGRAEPVATTTS